MERPTIKTPDTPVPPDRRQRGFTFLELVITVLIMGAVATVVSVRWQPPGDYTVAYQAERFAMNLRHAQLLAVIWQQPLRLVVSGSGYQVECVNGTGFAPCVAAGDVVTDPATRDPLVVLLDDGVVISGSDLELDEWGRPSSGGSLLNLDQSYTFTADTQAWGVDVSRLTGLVSLSRL